MYKESALPHANEHNILEIRIRFRRTLNKPSLITPSFNLGKHFKYLYLVYRKKLKIVLNVNVIYGKSLRPMKMCASKQTVHGHVYVLEINQNQWLQF